MGKQVVLQGPGRFQAATIHEMGSGC